MAKFTDRTGEKRVSNEGYSMEIVAYRGAKDIDILVDGKHLLVGRAYRDFSRGAVHNPEHTLESPLKEKFAYERIGEKGVNNEGHEMEIIAYRKSTDIDVLVDGTHLRTNCHYDAFKRGQISSFKRGAQKQRIGEKGVNNEGYEMEIVDYRNADDIDVLVDGKYLRKNRLYKEFKTGQVSAFYYGTVKDRVGEKGLTNKGYTTEILAYRGAEDIDVLIDGYYVAKGVHYSAFKSGSLSNPYHRSVYGVGYLGVGKYRSTIDAIPTKVFEVWRSMLARCYDTKFLERNPSYRGCTVDEKFHNFQEFGVWYDENYYVVGSESMALDKDILIKGNTVYAPDACIFVPVRINTLVQNRRRDIYEYPVGVSMNKRSRRYTAVTGTLDGKKYLGTFDTPEEAFLAYKTAKEAYIKQVADEYKDKIPQKLYDALYAYTIEITD